MQLIISILHILIPIIVAIALCAAIIVLIIKLIQTHRNKNYYKTIALQTMRAIGEAADAKDSYMRGHSSRVSRYSAAIAQKMNLPHKEIEEIKFIALLHDCGKLEIPDSIFSKVEELSQEEREIINSHTILGGKVLEQFDAINGVRDGALYHHERYDGKGYPYGLKGEQIPLCARIIGVADAYDAMNTDRSYRKHLLKAKILEELERCAGTQFDPNVARIMRELILRGEVL